MVYRANSTQKVPDTVSYANWTIKSNKNHLSKLVHSDVANHLVWMNQFHKYVQTEQI